MQSSAKKRTKGFALLITVTLLAFLVLLLVSLATLTRVETQVASNNQQLSQARQNALLALNIALGQLQKYAGPDQRTTARSDMDGTLANVTTQSGRWVGAYGRRIVTGDATSRNLYSDIPSRVSADITTNSSTNGSQAQLLNWLVSGNEGAAFNPSTAIDANGQIISSQAPSSFAYSATDTISNLAGSTALNTNITIGGSTKFARLLVGPNSVSTTSDYVAAPLVDIALAPGIVPGTGGASNTTVGRYAWWIGDEGTKARINLPAASTPAAQANAFVSSPRAAIELVDGVHSVGSTTAVTTDMIGTAYSPSQANLTGILNTKQLPMLTPASGTALAAAVKYRFHDLTGYSSSILSDTYAGGLKKDLSSMLGTNHAATPTDTTYLFTPETNIAPNLTNDFGLPTWGQLRSFAQTTASTAPASPGLTPRAPTMAISSNPTIPAPTNVGISPVMTYGVAGFKYIAPLGDGTIGNPIQLAILPIVVLWNPYTVPIKGTDASGNPMMYEFGIRKAFANWIQLQGHDAAAASPYTWGPQNIMESVDMGSAGGAYFRFVIDGSAGIPPGQSLVYTLQTNGVTYNGQNVLSNSAYHPLYYTLMPARSWIGTAVAGSASVPTAPGGIYRVGVNASASPATNIYQTRTINGNVIPATLWQKGFSSTDGNFGGAGNGWHEAYFGTATPAAGTAPSGTYPWRAPGFTSQQLFQAFTLINAPFVGTPPYGPGSTGYSASGATNGLIQSEGTLASVVAAPSFRLQIFNQFSQTPTALARGRWIVNSNPRGFMSMQSGGGFSGQPTVNSWPPDLANPGTGLRTSAGTGLKDVSGPVDTTLYEFRPDTMPLLTIGQLQHANLGWSAGIPSYAIGNSNNGWAGNPAQLVSLGQLSGNTPGSTFTASYSQSWLLNRSLWDKYFVSTVPYAGTGTSTDTDTTAIPAVLPNSRHILYGTTSSDAALRTKLDVDQAAAHLLLSGGFNINSTSEQAWRAILGGSNQLNYDPTGANVGGNAWPKAVFSRFSKPTTNSVLTSAAPNAAWQGYRQLTEAQIAQFATNIVAQIRARGPFVSLSDFINRRLVATGVFPQANDARLKGTIQAAIDATTSGTAAINDGTMAPFSGNLVTGFFAAPSDPFATGSATPATPTVPYGSATAFAPQFLSQADVLSSIGSELSARSDTFTVRTYGETVSPADSTVITGKAWCEAVVQRLPDYVDSLTDPNAHSAPTATINKTMGRRFKIISFRWLSPNDI